MKYMWEMMPWGAKYECYEGYEMYKTMKDDMGWCRKDGSFEIPRCELKDDFNGLEFRLLPGGEKKLVDKVSGKAFGGIVQSRMVKASGTPMGEWEYACNDGFNDYAAGAICRTQGFMAGAKIQMTKRMSGSKAVQADGFGWTYFSCKYDDVLPQSMWCEATRYKDAMKEMEMKAKCFDFDRMAVKCFKSATFNVGVELISSKRVVMCQVKMEKKGMPMKLDNATMKVKWMLDDKEEELQSTFKKRKGFMIKTKELNKKEYQCMRCMVQMGDMIVGKSEETCKKQ